MSSANEYFIIQDTVFVHSIILFEENFGIFSFYTACRTIGRDILLFFEVLVEQCVIQSNLYPFYPFYACK